MHKFRESLVLLLFTLGMANLAWSQPDKESTLPETASLFLGTWIGQGKTPEGETYQSELAFSWTLNENFLEVNNTIIKAEKRQQYARTYYGWQPVMGQLVFWSFDKDGTINEGVAELEGSSLKHEWRSFSQGGEIRDWRSILLRHDKDNFTFSVLDGNNEVMFSMKYRRTSAQN